MALFSQPIRSIIRPLSNRTASSPIETLVAVFILVTLAYFQILSSIKQSNFFSSPDHGLSSLKPAVVSRITTAGAQPRWLSVSENAWYEPRRDGQTPAKVEFVQIIASLDESSKLARSPRTGAVDPVLTTELMTYALANFTDVLTQSLLTDSGQTYPSLCYATGEHHCLTSLHLAGRTQTLTLSFDSTFGRDKFVSALQGKIFQLGGDGNHGVRFEARGREENIGEMRSGKWVAYALRALVLRFWALAKVRSHTSFAVISCQPTRALTQKADSADILIVLIGYILMHGTFVNLFLHARKLGSNFWLGESEHPTISCHPLMSAAFKLRPLSHHRIVPWILNITLLPPRSDLTFVGSQYNLGTIIASR
jgi:hydroxymethylglutaryl-CoA reductase (NADPH)